MKGWSYPVYFVSFWVWMLIFQQVIHFTAGMLGINDYPWGVLMALFLAGTILGVFFARRYRRPFRRREKWSICAMVVASIVLLVAGLSFVNGKYDVLSTLEGGKAEQITGAVGFALALWIPLAIGLGFGTRLVVGFARKRAAAEPKTMH